LTDFPLDDALKAALANPECIAWMMENAHGSASWAWGEGGAMVYRFEDEAEAELFAERWLRK
jgi:hypothetical protein